MKNIRMPSLGQWILIILVIFSMLPIYFILENSVKTPIDFAASTINIPTQFEWSNY